MTEHSPILKAAVVLGGIIALCIAVKVGQLVMRLFFGFVGLALLGAAIWWLLMRH